jgi:hypothetical protein
MHLHCCTSEVTDCSMLIVTHADCDGKLSIATLPIVMLFLYDQVSCGPELILICCDTDCLVAISIYIAFKCWTK